MTLQLTAYEAKTYSGTFPGITPDESALLQDYFALKSEVMFSVSIDVFVGPGDTSSSGFGATVDRMWAAITRKRIDAVVHMASLTWVVEAKVHARMRAVTQVRKYAALYRRELAPARPVRPLLICRTADLGVDLAMMNYGGLVMRIPARSCSTA